jgi:chitinase
VTETLGGSTTIIGGSTLSPVVVTVTPNPHPTTTQTTPDPVLNTGSTSWKSGGPPGPPKATGLPGCKGCGSPCTLRHPPLSVIKGIYSHELTATSCLGILFCDPGCPFCPPGAFGNSNGDGEDDNTSSSTESSSQTAAATVELVATGVVDVFVTDLPALSDLTVSDALPSCHLIVSSFELF